MEIKVKVDKLKSDIEKALDDYDGRYEKLLDLYHRKLVRYTTYVTKEIKKKNRKNSQLKYPPSPPAWERNLFVKILEALNAHQGKEVEMDDSEYSKIRSGIIRLRENIRTATASLNALSY